MAHLKVYENISVSQKNYPYLLDIQSDLLSELRTTVVIPLAPFSATGKAVLTKLCPVVMVKSEKLVVLTPQLAGVERKVLGRETADLFEVRSEIIAALDFLISGI